MGLIVAVVTIDQFPSSYRTGSRDFAVTLASAYLRPLEAYEDFRECLNSRKARLPSKGYVPYPFDCSRAFPEFSLKSVCARCGPTRIGDPRERKGLGCTPTQNF